MKKIIVALVIVCSTVSLYAHLESKITTTHKKPIQKELKMSAVTFDRLEGQYNYSLENSTQSKNLKLLIDQSDAVLKVAIMNERGVKVPVGGDLIRGLP